MYGLTTITPPAAEPVSLALAKTHLRIDHDDEDTLITGWIKAAREFTEINTGRRWVEQGLRLTLTDWPCGGVIRLPVEPVSAVDAVRYFDADGTEQTLDASGYQTWLDHSPPLVAPAPGASWPTVRCGRFAAVTLEFTAGFGSEVDVPEAAKIAILLCLGYWDENRGISEASVVPAALGISPGALRLLDSLRTGGYV